MTGLDPVERAELDEFRSRVEAEGQVDLESLDEAELLALGERPVPRLRLGPDRWPAYVGVARGRDGSTHPAVRDAGRRLVERGLAERDPDGATGWRPVGQARLLVHLLAGGSATLGWSSEPGVTDGRTIPVGLYGAAAFSRWSWNVAGVCLVQSATVLDGLDAEQPARFRMAACTPTVAVQHVVQAVFREPLTQDERQGVAGSRSGLVLQSGGEQPFRLELWHSWSDDTATGVPFGAGPPRRGLRGPRGEKFSPPTLSRVLLPIAQAAVDATRDA